MDGVDARYLGLTANQLAKIATDLKAENAELRERTELLVTLLRNDCDIEASWDGLRKFWYIGLTEGGCLMRDRACKAEAKNAKLRELVRMMWKPFCWAQSGYDVCLTDEQDKAIRDFVRELGIEVN